MKEQLKELSETSAVRDIKDESYLASIGFVNYSSSILSKSNILQWRTRLCSREHTTRDTAIDGGEEKREDTQEKDETRRYINGKIIPLKSLLS